MITTDHLKNFHTILGIVHNRKIVSDDARKAIYGFAPIFPDICYHLTHYKPAAADIPVASDNPAH
ncbi:hypothetical protein ACRWD7_21655, partial [Escherichia coli]